MHNIVATAEPDFGRFSAADEATARQFLRDLTAIVHDGPSRFDDASVSTLLGGSVKVVQALATGRCEGFLHGSSSSASSSSPSTTGP